MGNNRSRYWDYDRRSINGTKNLLIHLVVGDLPLLEISKIEIDNTRLGSYE